MTAPFRESTCEILVRRIEALVETHPEILTMTRAWDLFKIPGFECGDLDPSAVQATLALEEVQSRVRGKVPRTTPPEIATKPQAVGFILHVLRNQFVLMSRPTREQAIELAKRFDVTAADLLEGAVARARNA